MPEQANPFKRLYDELNLVIDYSRERGGYAINELARNVWIAAFDLDQVGFLKNLYQMMLIVNSCEQLVTREQTINRELYLSQLQKLTTGLSMLSDVEGYWGRFQATFNDDFMTSLLMMSENISFHGGEEVIPDEQLKSLQTDVENLIDDVLSSELDSNIKSVLLDGLESVRQAIMDYRIFGAEGIRQALDRNVGLIFRYGEDFKNASENEGKQVLSDFFDLLKRVDTLVSIGMRIKQLGEPVVQFLMLGSGG